MMADNEQNKQKEEDKLKRRAAVAIQYKDHDIAPQVVAKGRGEIARRIIELAKENNVYVHQSPELLSLLMQVDLDARIPPQLYLVVAELLAWLYHLESDTTEPAPDTDKTIKEQDIHLDRKYKP